MGEVVDKARPLENVYCYEPENKVEIAKIEEAVTEAMERETSPHDSYPKPNDRVRWVRELVTSIVPAEDDENEVWGLFASRIELEHRMTAEVRERLAEQGISVRAEEVDEAAP